MRHQKELELGLARSGPIGKAGLVSGMPKARLKTSFFFIRPLL
jgi:hypothetical protein